MRQIYFHLIQNLYLTNELKGSTPVTFLSYYSTSQFNNNKAILTPVKCLYHQSEYLYVSLSRNRNIFRLITWQCLIRIQQLLFSWGEGVKVMIFKIDFFLQIAYFSIIFGKNGNINKLVCETFLKSVKRYIPSFLMIGVHSYDN